MTETQSIGSIAETLNHLTNEEIKKRIQMFENNIKQYKVEMNKINHDMKKVKHYLLVGSLRSSR